jgi:hypothetical protein
MSSVNLITSETHHQNETDANNNNSKMNYYLIEKFLSENDIASKSKKENLILTKANTNTNLVVVSNSTPTKLENQGDNDIEEEHMNDDLVSETGTYTIDEDEKPSSSTSPYSPNNQNSETNPPNVEKLVSARAAAIDQTFGLVIKRPEIDSNNTISPNNSTILQNLEKTPTRISRNRTKTYCLTNDINIPNEIKTNTSNTILQKTMINSANNNIHNSSFSASSSSSISSYSIDSKLKKTSTYDIISSTNNNNNEAEGSGDLVQKIEDEKNANSLPNSSRTANTVVTEVLLGDTEKLIQELRKRRADKKEQLKSKLNTINTSEKVAVSNLSSSSNSSSSTNLSSNLNQHQNTDSTNGQSFYVNKPKTWTIPTAEQEKDDTESTNFNSLSTRATVDFELNSNRNKNSRGMAFDIPVNNHNNNLNPNVVLTAEALKRLECPRTPTTTKPRANKTKTSVLSRSSSACRTSCDDDESETFFNDDQESSTTNRSEFTNLTLIKRFELAKSKQLQTKKATNDDLDDIQSNLSVLNSPKSGVSLGARIQQRAQQQQQNLGNERRISSDAAAASPTTQYTNRTLFLRQQTAKAKRESFERKSTSSTLSITSTKQQQVGSKTRNSSCVPSSSSSATKRSSSKATAGDLSSVRSNSHTQSPLSNSNSTTSSLVLSQPSNRSYVTSKNVTGRRLSTTRVNSVERLNDVYNSINNHQQNHSIENDPNKEVRKEVYIFTFLLFNVFYLNYIQCLFYMFKLKNRY